MLTDSLGEALAVDVLCVSACFAMLVRYGRPGHSHPMIILLLFHVTVFTARMVSLLMGAGTMFSGMAAQFDPVTVAEILRAAAMADASLVAFTAGCVAASMADLKARAAAGAYARPYGGVTLSPMHVRRVAAVALPFGCLGMALFAKIPGLHGAASESMLSDSSYLAITPAWVGLSLIMLLYLYGFERYLVVPFGLFLIVMMFQGYHRFRVIIPTILVLQIYLDRHRMRWPTARMLVIYGVLLILAFPMKSIGRMAQEGADLSDIISVSTASITEAISGEHGDTQFMDEFAMTLTLVDDSGKYQYGKVYLPLLTLPIPRQLWPDKPSLAGYIREISTPRRPMGEMGMIVTYMGELYANFGPLGVYLGAYAIGYLLSRFYFNAYWHDYFSTIRLAYLTISCNLIQVYRDGLLSLVIFTAVNMMPLTVLVILHYFSPYEPPPAGAAVGEAD